MSVTGQAGPGSVARSPLAEAERLLRTPPPAISEAEAADFARSHYGRSCHVRLLTGERDRNFLLRDAQGWSAVLKFYNPVDDALTRDLQTATLEHLRLRATDCPVPRILRPGAGGLDVPLTLPGLSTAAVMITCLPGANPEPADLNPTLRANVGRVIGHVSRALADFDHPRARRAILWDMMLVGTLGHLTPLIDTQAGRAAIESWLEHFSAHVRPAALRLPHQPIHNDVSLSNLLIDPQRRDQVTGVIDFGDLVHAPRVCEFAVAASYFITPADDPAVAVAQILRPADLALTDDEIVLLPDLIKARLATRILLSGWRAQLFPDNRSYILRSNSAAWALWTRMADEETGQMAERIAALLTEGRT